MSKSKSTQPRQISLEKKNTTNTKRRLVICLPQKRNSKNQQIQITQEQSSIEKLQKKQRKKSKDKNDKNTQTQDQYGKLLEITVRCFDYFKKFEEERKIQDTLCQKAFQEIINTLEKMFKTLWDSLNNKKIQLINHINDRKYTFIADKNKKEKQLKESLTNIHQLKKKSVLELLPPHKSHQQAAKYISTYAHSLNCFYQKVEQIEKINLRECLDQISAQLNKTIKYQVKEWLNQKLTKQEEHSFDMSISFNNEQLFSFKEQSQDNQCQKQMKKQQKPQILLEIQNKQRQRLKNIKCYKQTISIKRESFDFLK